MKRSYIKRKTKLRKNSKSERSKLIKKCDELFFKVLVKERGRKCEICNKTKGIGPSHILSKQKYPRLRYSQQNIILMGWYCCHQPYHHDYYDARDRIVPKIKELLGNDYEEQLKILHETMSPTDTTTLRFMKAAYEKVLEEA